MPECAAVSKGDAVLAQACVTGAGGVISLGEAEVRGLVAQGTAAASNAAAVPAK